MEPILTDNLTGMQGTLAFSFSLSRTDYFAFEESARLVLIECPSGKLEYSSGKFYLSFAGDPDELGPRRFQFTHFKGQRWYHLAIAWDASAGAVDLYLNGLHQENSLRKPWQAQSQAGPLQLDGDFGDLHIELAHLETFGRMLLADEIAALSAAVDSPALEDEGRTYPSGSLDLVGLEIECVYEADFHKPLSVIEEDALFEGDRRVRQPAGFDWVLEGSGRAFTKDGHLHLVGEEKSSNLDLWCTQPLPADFLLEFDFTPGDPNSGLCIIWFCATGPEGQSVFAPSMPKRQAVWPRYHTGQLQCYHTSFWAIEPWNSLPRGTSNLRKNPGHRLVSIGRDNIAGQGPGPHRVRLMRMGNRIQLETNGKLSVQWEDGGEYGPPWPGGYFALHHMYHTGSASYSNLKAYRLTRK